MIKLLLILNVPRERTTTWPEGQLLRADCMPNVASVKPLPYAEAEIAAQMVVRFGIPPGTPT